MITPAMEKGETFVKPPFAELSIRLTRRPGPLAKGQVKAACAPAVEPVWSGESPSIYDSSGKISAEMLPGRRQRTCFIERW